MSQHYRPPVQAQIAHAPGLRNQQPSSQPIVYRLRARRRGRIDPFLTLMGLLFAATLIVFLITISGAAVAYSYYQFGNRIFPGVKVLEMDLSGMSSVEATEMLERSWNRDITLLATNGIQSLSIPPSQVGLTLDTTRTVQTAQTIGRSGTILERLSQIASGFKAGRKIEPILEFDPDAARQGLEAIRPQMSQPAVDATIQVVGIEVVPVPAVPGYTIHIEETLNQLSQNPGEILAVRTLPLALQPVIPMVTDVSPVLEEAQRLLKQPASVQIYDPISAERITIPIPVERLASWLRVSQGATGIEIALDEAGIAAYLSEISTQIGPGRSIEPSANSQMLAEAIVQGSSAWMIASHPATTYTVQPGDTLLKIGWKSGIPFWMILQANPGVDPEALLAGSELILPSKDDLIPLPVIANKRIVIHLNRQRLMVYQDDNLLGQYVISTGIDRSPTQPGVFQVQTHDPNAYASVWDLYMPHFLGIYEAWPGFLNGIHGLPLLSNGQRMWANSLGRPASYGCIILGLEDARWLYNWAEDGVIVEIRE